MKAYIKWAVIIFVMCGLYSGTNWAHGRGGWSGGHGGWGGGYRGHSSFGFYFGGPGYYPYGYGYGYGYGYPYYYPPAVLTVPTSPPVYIQQAPPAATSPQDTSAYWHYCTNPEGYYPYVKECPGGWQLVEPTPPAPR